MVKSLTVTNHKGEVLKLELGNPEEAGLIVQKIVGIGPSSANINTNELGTMDGSFFTSARVNSRNIVLTLVMMLAPTVEASRQKTYKYFPVTKRVRLLIETDARKVEAVGYVETNEPIIFSDQASTQISIICPDPYFYSQGDVETVFSGAQPMFEFPFENESTTDNLLELGEVLLDTRVEFEYHGDADTGVVITIHAMDTAKGINLYNVDTGEAMLIDTNKIETITGAPFVAGEDIIISTVKGNKYMRLLRNGEYTNIISALNKGADWFQLSSGTNVFNFTASEGEQNLIITFSYKNAYGGV